MRLSLRFVVPLLVALGIFAYAAIPLVDKLIATTVADPLHDLMQSGNQAGIQRFFMRLTQDERLFAVAFCPADHADAVATPTLPAEIRCSDLGRFAQPSGDLLQTATGPVFVSVRPMVGGGDARLVLGHDMRLLARR